MGYLSLYRKWRPKTFDDLAGQTTVVKTLKNAILHNRISHAYLFCGPRGTGKTSTAKLFAKALNCEHGPTIEPCNQCFSCEQINSGRSVDVIEIDAASNRRIDEIRDLREKVKFSPSEGDYKVYIIDEVHMLTKEAFNALLKTLEEPPQNVVFILATTEPHKILPTIISRCQRFDFGLLSVRDLKQRMKYISEEEGVAVSDEALNLIARTAEGGARDAISILDQAIAFGGDQVQVEDVLAILGKVDQRILSRIVEVVASHNSKEALELVNEIVDQGKDMNQFVKDLLFHFRDLLLLKECGVQNLVVDLPDELKYELAQQAENFTIKDLLRILEVLSEADQQLKFASQPRLILEMCMIKLAAKETDTSLANLIGRLARLEDMVESGNIVSTQANASTTVQETTATDDFAEKVRQMRERGSTAPQEPPTRTQPTVTTKDTLTTTAAQNEAKDDTPPWEEAPAAKEAAQKQQEVPSVKSDVVHNEAQVGGGNQPGVTSTVKPSNNPQSVTESPVSSGEVSPTTVHPDTQPTASAVPVISQSEMENYWQVTLELLNKYAETRKLRAFLLMGKPYKVIGDTLYVVFPQSSTFHKTNAEKEISYLERALKKVTGMNINAACIFEGEEPEQVVGQTNVSESSGQEMREPVVRSHEEAIHDPIVQKALKIFGGRIIQVENE